jgi:hypothetical protein
MKGQRHAVGEGEVQVVQPALAAEHDSRAVETRERVDPDRRARLLGQRERHASAAAAGVEHAAADCHARALQERDDLRAAVVLEQRVIVLGAEPNVRVRLDGALVNASHAPSRTCR